MRRARGDAADAPGGRRVAPPLDEAALEALALRYAGRFATSRVRLATYLQRKLRERGWAGPGEPDPVALAERFAANGWVDDAALAEARGRSLARRGLGRARVAGALRGLGIAQEDGAAALDTAAADAWTTALRFAERRRFGPFAAAVADPVARARAIAAMLRAGHALRHAVAIVDLAPGDPIPGADD